MSRIAIMTGLVGLAAALAAGPSSASPPSPEASSVPPLLLVVARDAAGNADPAGAFTVIARRLSGLPVAGASVALVFSDCSDLRVCTDQQDPNVTVDCGLGWIRGTADANGSITFHVMGCGHNGGASPGPADSSMRVFADGVYMRTVRVAILDQTGCDGMGSADLSAWIADYLSGQPFARSDYDGDGVLSSGDLALWVDAYLAAHSAQGCSAACP